MTEEKPQEPQPPDATKTDRAFGWGISDPEKWSEWVKGPHTHIGSNDGSVIRVRSDGLPTLFMDPRGRDLGAIFWLEHEDGRMEFGEPSGFTRSGDDSPDGRTLYVLKYKMPHPNHDGMPDEFIIVCHPREL